jgi:prepilin-type N-terminal cleavage/methylation domain-containing protein
MQVRFQQQTTAVLKNARRGFNLLEILVVVAIVVMLAGLGSFYVFKEYERSQEKAAFVRAKQLAADIEAYNLGKLDQEKLTSLEQLAQGDARKKPDELLDPWGQMYQLQPVDDSTVVVYTTRKGKTISSADSGR